MWSEYKEEGEEVGEASRRDTRHICEAVVAAASGPSRLSTDERSIINLILYVRIVRNESGNTDPLARYYRLY